MAAVYKSLRPDAKGRIPLGLVLTKGVSSFRMYVDPKNRIILEPRVEIPADEKWLFENNDVAASLRRGLADSAAGRVKKLGRFKKYLDNDATS